MASRRDPALGKVPYQRRWRRFASANVGHLSPITDVVIWCQLHGLIYLRPMSAGLPLIGASMRAI